MNILITGATGFIGQQVGRLCVEHGHSLTIVSRKGEKARNELSFPAQIFTWAGETEAFPAQALDGIEAIIHLAGEPVAGGRWTAERKRKIRDSRVLGTKRLISAILAHPSASKNLKTFVLGSAIGLYGDRGDEKLDESSERGEGFLAQVVNDWEAQCEALLTDPRFAGARVVKVRTGIVFGPRGGALQKMLAPFKAGVGGRLGSGEQWMSWISLKDVARLFVFATEQENVRGVLNGVAPEPTQNKALTQTLARVLHRPAVLPVPRLALRVVFGEMADSLLESGRVFPKRTQEAGFQFQSPDLEQTLREAIHDANH